MITLFLFTLCVSTSLYAAQAAPGSERVYDPREPVSLLDDAILHKTSKANDDRVRALQSLERRNFSAKAGPEKTRISAVPYAQALIRNILAPGSGATPAQREYAQGVAQRIAKK